MIRLREHFGLRRLAPLVAFLGLIWALPQPAAAQAALETSEAGGKSSFPVELTSAPSSSVTIAVSSSDETEGTVSPTSLTFTPANWKVPQRVTVTGVDDYIHDGDQRYTVVLAPAESEDKAAAGLDLDDISVINRDNDEPPTGIALSVSRGSIAEGAGETEVRVTATVIGLITYGSDVTVTVSVGPGTADAGDFGAVPGFDIDIPAGFNGATGTFRLTPTADDIDETRETVSVSGVANNKARVTPTTLALIDDDTAGVTVVESGVGTATTEATGVGRKDSFTVVLTSAPTADVTIAVSISDSTEATVAPDALTFTPRNWRTPQTVTVTGVDDSMDDGDQDYTVVLAAAESTDANYNGYDPDDVSATNADNDGAPTGIQLRVDPIILAEDAGETVVRVTATVPGSTTYGSDVTVAVSVGPGTAGTVDFEAVPGFDIVIAAGAKGAAQAFKLTPTADDIDEGDETVTVSGVADNKARVTPATLTLTDAAVGDKDVREVTTEAGGTARFAYALPRRPTANVTITVTSSDETEGTVSPASLTFTPANWNIWQRVTVTGVDDTIHDGDQRYTIKFTASYISPKEEPIEEIERPLINTDNDEPPTGIALSVHPATLSEGDGETDVTVTARVTGSTTYGSDVTVAVSVAGSGAADAVDFGAVSGFNIVIPAGARSATGTFRLTPTVDDIDGSDETVSVSGVADNSATVTDTSLTITDDDVAGVTVVERGGETVTAEAGGKDSFTVVLTSEPTADVTIPVSSSDETEATVSPTSLTFTPENWRTPQRVTVTGVDDTIDDGNMAYTVVLAPAESTDVKYSGMDPEDVSATNADNDEPPTGIALSVHPATLSEGDGETDVTVVATVTGSGIYGSDVTVAVSVGPGTADAVDFGAVPGFDIVIPAGTRSAKETFRLTPVDDVIKETSETVTVSGVAGNKARVTPATLTISDDDTAGVTVFESDGDTATTEAEGSGRTDSFTVVLTSPPSSSVRIEVSSSDTTEATVSPAALRFTPKNWKVPQRVTVTGVDDTIDDGDQDYTVVLAPAKSKDVRYSGMDPDDVSATNADNDGPPTGIALRVSPGAIAEGDGETEVTVTARVTGSTTYGSDVTVTVTVSVAGSGTAGAVGFRAVSGFDIVIPAGARSAAGTFRLTPTADDIDGSSETVTVSGVAGNSATVKSAVLTITDDDTAGVTVVESDSDTATTEAGGTDSFTVVLTSAPTANVRIAVSSSDDTEATVSPVALTFTGSDWKVPQRVTVTGVDDNIDDGDQNYTVVLAPAVSTDARYSGMDPEDVPATNADNDELPTGIALSVRPGSIAEGAGETEVTVTATVTGSGIYGSDVTVTVSVAGSGTPSAVDFGAVSGFDIVIPAGARSATGTFRLTPTADAVDESDETVTVSGVAGNKARVTPATLTLTDDDIGAWDGTQVTTEAGGTFSFSHKLNWQPKADVRIAVSSSDTSEGTVDKRLLTFTSKNWNIWQRVTVTGVDDTIDDGDQPYTVVLAPARSDDLSFFGLKLDDISVINRDNDGPPTGIALSVDPIILAEDAGATEVTVTATVTGSTTYGSDVTVAVSVAGSGTADAVDFRAVPGFDIVIPAGTGSATGTFRLTPTADAVYESDETVTVSGVAGNNATVKSAALTLTEAGKTARFGVIGQQRDGRHVTTEAGSTVRFVYALSWRPAADVIIAVSSSDETEGTVLPTSLTFTSENWNKLQTVTLTGVDDTIDDGNQRYTIKFTASGINLIDDIEYPMINTDDDGPPTGIALSVSPGSIAEGAGETEVTVTAAVTGTTTYGSDVTVAVSVAGSGTDGAVGFRAVPGFDIVIPAGAKEAAGTFKLTPTADDIDGSDRDGDGVGGCG